MINHTKVDAIRKKVLPKSGGVMTYDEPAKASPQQASPVPAARPPVQDSTKKKKKNKVDNLKLRNILLQQAVPPVKGQPPIPANSKLALD